MTGGGNATNGNVTISSTPTPSVFLGQGGNMRAGGYILGRGLTAVVIGQKVDLGRHGLKNGMC